MGGGLFEGVTVLDFTQVIAGPFATMQLALQGADVVKIERPGRGGRPGGDMMRAMMAAPPYREAGTSSGFAANNLGKRSLTLDLKAPESAEILAPLIARADVLVESFRPGVMAGLGLDAATLRARHPSLVYASISGHGQSGPKAGEAAYDGAIQAESGMMSVTGYPDGGPLRSGYFAVDVPTGYAAAFAIAGGLLKARATGEGSTLDVAMMDTALSLMAFQVNDHFQAGIAPARLGNMSAARMPSDNTYATADGAIAVVALTRDQIAALAGALGLSGEPSEAELAEAFAKAPSADWARTLRAAGVPCAVVRDLPEALADPQLEGRAVLDRVAPPTGVEGGPMTVIGAPFTTDPRPAAPGPAPALGEHTHAILAELGFDAARIATWREKGIV